MNTQKKRQVVYSIGLAKHLISKGFNIADLDLHREKRSAIFVFNNSPELQDEIDLYMESLNK